MSVLVVRELIFQTIKKFDIGSVISVHNPTKQLGSQQSSRGTSGIYEPKVNTKDICSLLTPTTRVWHLSLLRVLSCSVLLSYTNRPYSHTHFSCKKPNSHGTELDKHSCYLDTVFSHIMPYLALHDSKSLHFTWSSGQHISH